MSTIALASNTLAGTPASGAIEYNGQFYGTDSNSSRSQLERITQGTAVASTSGTSITFSSIPAWAKKITVMFSGVSTSGTSNIMIQVGSGSVTTSGYLGAASQVGGTNAVTGTQFTTGIGVTGANAAANIIHGSVIISNITSNTWVAQGVVAQSNNNNNNITASSIALGGTLDRVVVTTVNGTDTFDAGSINIIYEG